MIDNNEVKELLNICYSYKTKLKSIISINDNNINKLKELKKSLNNSINIYNKNINTIKNKNKIVLNIN